MKRNDRKKHIHIDRETGSNEIFAMIGKTESETESDTENLLEDSDREYIAEEPIPDNKKESHQLLILKVKSWIQMSHQLKNLKRKRTSRFGTSSGSAHLDL